MKLLLLSAVLVLAVLALTALGYVATEAWRNGATTLVESRIDEVDALLATALLRDMGGAQTSILMTLGSEQISLNLPYELSDIFARAFARFPYPESFFAWTHDRTDLALLFNRTDRLPPWQHGNGDESLFPVTIVRDSPVVDRLLAQVRAATQTDEEFSLFETSIDGTPYQVVARLYYDRAARDRVVAIVGFTVNLKWVESAYFEQITRQIERIGGRSESSPLSLSIIDERGRIVTQTRKPISSAHSRERTFPLAFFDTASVSLSTLRGVARQHWKARVSMADDAVIGDAESGARRMSLLLLLAAASAIVGLVLALYSLHRNLELAAMKADFVAMVTHELKTPLAGISLVGETLSQRRYASENAIAEYGRLLSKETTRLRRLVENVLSFSRLTSTKRIYSMSNENIRTLVLEALERLQPLIQEKSIEIRCEIPDSTPSVRCDREEITRVFENLIENAIKYSDTTEKKIEIQGLVDSPDVKVRIQDNGRGIMPEDIPYVFERFFRGKNAGSGGSGLGLAIAQAIVKDHGGNISISSTVGQGTVVTVTIPTAEIAQ